jgi:tetratricopeptide (TPR) repeat protein
MITSQHPNQPRKLRALHPRVIAPGWLVCIGLLLLLVGEVPGVQAQGNFDRIVRRNGSDRGEVTQINSQEVTLSKGGVAKRIPSEEIRSIHFAGEPAELNQARLAVARGQYGEAQKILAGLSRDGIGRDAIIQDIDYYDTLCAANLALAGQGTLDQAIGQVSDYFSRHRKSYHLPAAIELWGDLLMRAGKQDEARRQYEKLAKARSPIYKMRSALLVGQSYQTQEKHNLAQAEFEKVLQQATEPSVANSSVVQEQKLAAQLGKAISQAATGAVDVALETVKQVIAQADPEDARLQGQAYNALGECYLNIGDQKAALYAFLHVDLLYSKVPELHAQALSQLARLWPVLGYELRGRDARQKLNKWYPASRWASQ